MLEKIRERLGVSLAVNGAALLCMVLLAVPLGALSAWKPGSRIDRYSSVIGYMLYAVPVFWAPPALLDRPVRLEYARWRDGLVQGRVLVRNLGYDKQVVVRHSTDGWQSEHDTYAQFDGISISPELEYWRFTVHLPQPGTDLRMAVRYQVGGQVHWDNHLGQDYLLPTPSGQERAIPEP